LIIKKANQLQVLCLNMRTPSSELDKKLIIGHAENRTEVSRGIWFIIYGVIGRILKM